MQRARRDRGAGVRAARAAPRGHSGAPDRHSMRAPNDGAASGGRRAAAARASRSNASLPQRAQIFARSAWRHAQ